MKCPPDKMQFLDKQQRFLTKISAVKGDRIFQLRKTDEVQTRSCSGGPKPTATVGKKRSVVMFNAAIIILIVTRNTSYKLHGRVTDNVT